MTRSGATTFTLINSLLHYSAAVILQLIALFCVTKLLNTVKRPNEVPEKYFDLGIVKKKGGLNLTGKFNNLDFNNKNHPQSLIQQLQVLRPPQLSIPANYFMR